jgi:TfoX/Sxy family transcriptional regulator of competence genes
MKWEKPAEDLVTFLDKVLKEVECEKRKMFGQYAYFLNGNMFVGVFQSDVFLRLSPDYKRELMEKNPKIRDFEPRKGQVMKEYILVPPETLLEEEVFLELLEVSIKYASSLPTKKKS